MPLSRCTLTPPSVPLQCSRVSRPTRKPGEALPRTPALAKSGVGGVPAKILGRAGPPIGAAICLATGACEPATGIGQGRLALGSGLGGCLRRAADDAGQVGSGADEYGRFAERRLHGDRLLSAVAP